MIIQSKDLNKDLLGEDCENVKEAVSKYGVQVVCDEEDKKSDADIVMQADETCENVKEVVSKIGMTVVCDEE